MFSRLLIILLIAAVVYFVITKVWGRVGPRVETAWARDPRFRATVTGMGIMALRAFLQRGLPGVGRWLSLLRWFR